MASASHCSKFCTKCSSVRVQAKSLIYLFFILFSIYLFFNKKYIQGSQNLFLLLLLSPFFFLSRKTFCAGVCYCVEQRNKQTILALTYWCKRQILCSNFWNKQEQMPPFLEQDPKVKQKIKKSGSLWCVGKSKTLKSDLRKVKETHAKTHKRAWHTHRSMG